MLRAPIVLMFAAVGLIVGAMFFVSDPGAESSPDAVSTPEPIPTEKYTPEYVSARSERNMQTAIARNHAAADSLIERRVSAANIPRSEPSGDRFDAPLSLDEARRVADRLLVGRVRAQYLAWGDVDEYPEIDVDVPYLVSVIGPETGGHFVHVARPAGVVDDIHGLGLSHGSWNPLLERGKRYALLTRKSDHPGAYVIIRTHSYALLDGDMVMSLLYLDSNDPPEPAPLSSLELR